MPDTPTINLCPTCGTRLSEDATRCLVCGADLAKPQKSDQSVKAMQASSMPQITLSLPVAILLFALFLVIGAVLVFVALRAKGGEWTEQELDQFLADANQFAPGSTKSIKVKDPEERKAIIDFLMTLK